MNQQQKNIANTIYLCLAFIVLGFFANFAQNEYGMFLVGISLAIIAFCFAIKIYLESLHTKWLARFNAGFMIVQVVYYLAFIVFNLQTENIAMPIILVSIFFNIFIAPIVNSIFYYLKRNDENIKYSLSNFIGNNFAILFCFGLTLKLFHFPSASALLVSSGGIFLILAIILSVNELTNNIKKNAVKSLIIFGIWIFLLLSLLGFVFKSQHWPGANALSLIGSLIFGITLITYLFLYSTQKIAFHSILKNAFHWNIRVLIFCFIVTEIWFIGMFNGISPKIYSNLRPVAYNMLYEKANDITKEGRMYDAKLGKFMDGYQAFLENRENDKLKKK